MSAGGYFRGHYLIQALPVLALAVGLGASLAGRWLGSAGLALFCVLWLGAQPWIFGMSIEKTLRRYDYLRLVTSVDVGYFLRRAGSGSLFVLASEPQIFHYSGCRVVSPMVLMNPLLFGGYPSSRQRQKETLAGILRDMPDYMVLSFQRAGAPMFPTSDPWFDDRVVELVRERYQLAGVILFGRRGVHEARSVDPGARGVDLLIFRRTS